METAIDLKSLTAAQKKELMDQLAAEQRAEEERKDKERQTYKKLVVETVDDVFIELSKLSSLISQAKASVFNNFSSILDLKRTLYGVKDGQQSHTFSNVDSTQSITIGYRIVDAYDDTVNSGVEMVKEWIYKQAKSEETAALVDIVNGLLKKDAKGNLKANRVLELQNHADKINDPDLLEGVRIIREAYKPKRTSFFVEANYVDGGGQKQSLPLSITSVPFPTQEPDFQL